jgi:hypothetical protein
LKHFSNNPLHELGQRFFQQNNPQPGTSVLPSACLAKRIRKTYDDHETANTLFLAV